MKVRVTSNFAILGGTNPEVLDLDCAHLTLRELLDVLSRRSSYAPAFIQPDGSALARGWEIEVNGSPFCDDSEGLDAGIEDGDQIDIKLQMLAGG